MAIGQAKTKFVLEGEAQFRQAMRQSADAVKMLNAEEKLAKAQFEATGDAQRYAAEQARILKEKIEQQKKAVEAAEAAVKKLTDQGVAPNSKEMQTWRRKLIEAKTALAQTETRLNSVGTELGDEQTELQKTGTEADTFKGKLDQIGKAITVDNAIESIDRITGTIEKVVKKAAQAAKALWDMGTDAGQWADNLATAAAQAGVDAETYQSWQYASRFIDTEVADITKSWQDIQKKIKDGDVEYEASLAEMGVATRTATNEIRSSQDIFWDMIDVLHGMDNEQGRAALATKVFGNDWQRLMPLIEAGSKAYKDLAEQGRETAVVSNEQVAALGDMDDSMQELQAGFDKLKYDALAAMAPTFQTVAEAMSTAVQALDEFVQSEEGQAALTGLNEALQGIITSFLGEDGGKGTFESIVSTAKGAVEGFTTALSWISDHGEAVTGIITGLGGAWATLKVATSVLNFVKLLQGVNWAGIPSNLGGSGTPTTLPGAPGTGTPTAAPPAVNPATVGSGATTMALSAAAPMAVGIGMGVATLAGMWTLENEAAERRKNRAEMQEEAVASETAATGAEHLAEAYQTLKKAREDMQAAALQGKLTDELVELITGSTKFQSAAQTAGYGNVDWLTEFKFNGGSKRFFGGYGDTGIFGDMLAGIEEQSGELYDSMEEAGTLATQGMETGFDSGTQSLLELVGATGASMADAAKKALDEHSPSKVFEEIGQYAAIGLADGIYKRGADAINAARWLAQSVELTLRSALKIHSPSQVFEDLGAYTVAGFAQGIERNIGQVERAVGSMVGATGRPFSGRGGGSSDSVHVTLKLDKYVLADVMAPLVNDEIGAQISATRR